MKTRINFIIIFASIIMYLNASSQELVITFHPNPEQGIDAMIRSDNPDQNYAEEDDFMANAWTAGDFFIQRSLLKFDLSAIPVAATIKDAKLSLWCNIYTGHHQLDSGANASYLQRITAPWQENTVTWNIQPSTTSIDQVLLAASVTNKQDYPDINVTNLIKEMHASQSQNYGFMLRLVSEELYHCIVFASSDCIDPARWPQLVVTYEMCGSPTADFSSKSNWKQVQFIDSSLLATSWLWDFGDGQTSTEQNPSHSYTYDDDYQVCLEVKNECGQDTKCDTISICREPISNFSYSNKNNLIVAFKNLSLNADSLFWDFGDGQFSNEQNPVHKYTQDGTYTACLKAINNCGEHISCSMITICNEPVSRYDYYNCNYHMVAFIDSSLLATSWYWDFGDGTNSIEQNPVHKYAFQNEFTYYVCLTATNNCGQSIKCDSVYVYTPKNVCFTTSKENLSVQFTCLLDDFDNIRWDFGDGQSSELRNPEHAYTKYGIYEVQISGKNNHGTFVDRDTLNLLNRNPLIGNMVKTNVFSNPNNGSFSIGLYNFLSSGNPTVQINISSSAGGSSFLEQSYIITSDIEIIDFNLNELIDGLYFIKIKGQNGYWTNKVVINNK